MTIAISLLNKNWARCWQSTLSLPTRLSDRLFSVQCTAPQGPLPVVDYPSQLRVTRGHADKPKDRFWCPSPSVKTTGFAKTLLSEIYCVIIFTTSTPVKSYFWRTEMPNQHCPRKHDELTFAKWGAKMDDFSNRLLLRTYGTRLSKTVLSIKGQQILTYPR